MHRFKQIVLGSLMMVSLPLSYVYADYATVQTLGETTLVLEDETTQLSLFNLGNPAGAAFLPEQNRLDLLLKAGQLVEVSEFTTFPESEAIQYDSSNNTIYANVDPAGNTLLPDTVYSRKTGTLFAGLNDLSTTGFGGYLTWLSPKIIFQVVPQTNLELISSTDKNSDTSCLNGGGKLRAAWQLLPDIAVGSGISIYTTQKSSWDSNALAAYLNSISTEGSVFTSATDSRSLSLALEAGLAWKLAEIFDPDDMMEVGLYLQGAKISSANELHLDTGVTNNSLFGNYTTLAYPWEVRLQGVYSYKSVMDIALVTGYQARETYLAWNTNVVNNSGQTSPDYLYSDLRNLLYELSFRVRLPMVRNDDLRFGVVFNNQGTEHPYATGQLELFDLNTLSLLPEIKTASSSIGIGTAIVPDEGSIIALEYRLGSSKSRDSSETASWDDYLANSGFMRFAFGAQYRVIKGLFLRFGFTDQRVTYESKEEATNSGEQELVTEITNTSSIRAGVGVSDGPFRINLTAIIERITHSPEGWTFPDKPKAIKEVDKDNNHRLTGLLSFTWLF